MAETKLQPHQRAALKKLDKTDSLLLYHDMGSGKTLTALGASERYKSHANVIGPASLKNNFKKEKAKHNIKASTSYTTYSKPSTKRENALLVFDEAHLMGQTTSKRSRLPDTHQGRKELFMTGTPIRNHPSELVPIMRGLGVDIPRDPKVFNKRYIEEELVYPNVTGRLKGIKPGVEYKAKNLSDFRKQLRGKVHYYKPSKGKGYPEVKKEVVTVDMSEKQLESYRQLMGGSPDLQYKIRHGLPTAKTETNKMNAFLNATRQISNTPRAYRSDTTLADAPKLQAATKEIVKRYKTNPNYRGVTYSNYLESGVNPMAQRLEKHNIPYAKYTGKLSDKQKQETVEAFNTGKVKHLLVSGAGAEGLDLKGVRLSQILELHWNKAKTRQVNARGNRYMSHAHLPPEQRNLTIQRYVASVPENAFTKKKFKSADEYMYDLTNKKQRLNNQFLNALQQVGSSPT
ncbi:MAG: hypothetical protein H8D23_17650 [Candidatus Brocadiales bacterium]|nr:hypothetical protein [Candidatus Brocadiales bacterium]